MKQIRRRTFMLMPGSDARKAAKAATLDVDAVVLDLEDSIPPASKTLARDTVRASLAGIDFGEREIMVRINGYDTPFWKQDIEALGECHVDGVFIPKVEHVDQLDEMIEVLRALPSSSRTAAVFATIETALGLIHVDTIAASNKGLAGLFFGSGDYSVSTGIEISPDSLLYPRSRIVVAATANGLQPVDAAYFRDVKDGAAAQQDARLARGLGFSAKVLFHPNQIDPVNAVFTPTRTEIDRARRIIDAYEVAAQAGTGTLLLDGEFIAVDIALMAQRTLRRAGLLPENGHNPANAHEHAGEEK